MPERWEGDGVVVRRWRVEDAEAQERIVGESVEHLRPWMPWAAFEPSPLEERRARIAGWEQEWAAGGDLYAAVLEDGVLVGGGGLHHRLGPGGLEIGYWVHPAHTRRGLATVAARLLTELAFSVPSIDRVEIHHDRANAASAGIPRRLGYERLGEVVADRPQAPADTGVDVLWRVTREQWAALRPPGRASAG
ncbi:MAG: GNAT family N-acetyltransferase [Solirubrobacterales bacterium]|nr:GNAT family N-acetyltransferase [Solirubrobacterales bacterium]